MEPPDKNWFVEIDETVYEATTETIDQWIWNGTVLSKHRVSRGGQRWLEAGKVPRFADRFSPARKIKEVRSEGVGVRVAPPRTEERSAVTSQATVSPQPFGVKLLGGSAIALLVALLGGYLWAYQFTAPKDLAVINNSPEMQALQSKYDADNASIDERKTAPVPTAAAIPVAVSKLGPGTSKNIKNQTQSLKAGPGGGMSSEDLKRFRTAQAEFRDQTYAITPTPLSDPAVDALMNGDAERQSISLKFEADKNQVITKARTADARSKFYETFVLLFLGLSGLNLTRLSFSSQIGPDHPGNK